MLNVQSVWEQQDIVWVAANGPGHSGALGMSFKNFKSVKKYKVRHTALRYNTDGV